MLSVLCISYFPPHTECLEYVIEPIIPPLPLPFSPGDLISRALWTLFLSGTVAVWASAISSLGPCLCCSPELDLFSDLSRLSPSAVCAPFRETHLPGKEHVESKSRVKMSPVSLILG